MASLSQFSKTRRFKGLLVGYPGAGKTGSLASLANAGYKLRILDFDGNLDPLMEWIDPANYGNVDIVQCQDKLKKHGQGIIATIGAPTAFTKALDMLDHWKYKNENDEEVDLGRPREWGEDTVLVIDSGTNMGEAAMRRILALNNHVGKHPQLQHWGAAMKEQDAFCEMFASPLIGCHGIMTFHLKLIGPKIEEPKDSNETKDAKHQVQQIVPFRLFPSALGDKLPPDIARHFPYTILVEAKQMGQQCKRVLRLIPKQEFDVKVPLKGIANELPQESGLVTIFERLKGA